MPVSDDVCATTFCFTHFKGKDERRSANMLVSFVRTSYAALFALNKSNLERKSVSVRQNTTSIHFPVSFYSRNALPWTSTAEQPMSPVSMTSILARKSSVANHPTDTRLVGDTYNTQNVVEGGEAITHQNKPTWIMKHRSTIIRAPCYEVDTRFALRSLQISPPYICQNHVP